MRLVILDQSQGKYFSFQLNTFLVGWIRIFFSQATVLEIVNWDDHGGGEKVLSVLYNFDCLFFDHNFPTMLCYSSTLKHEQFFSQRIIEIINKVVNHHSAASSIIVSFLIRTELAITVKI